MQDEKDIDLAWKICNLISQLNDVLWDHYEERFIEQQKAEAPYRGDMSDLVDDDDF